MKISTASISEAGGREKNDDTVCVRQEENRTCVFVGDGLGGYEGGKIASVTAAEVILKHWENHSILTEMPMNNAAECADQAVKQQQSLRGGEMKTTIVVLETEGEQARWMHVGDSRLYHFRKGMLQSQTMDHSVSQMAVLMGQIEQGGIRFHADRNRVFRALGSENAKADISPLQKMEAGDAFLICTDGFWEYVYENEMEQALRMAETPEEWLEDMKGILTARAPKDNDNFTAVTVFVEE